MLKYRILVGVALVPLALGALMCYGAWIGALAEGNHAPASEYHIYASRAEYALIGLALVQVFMGIIIAAVMRRPTARWLRLLIGIAGGVLATLVMYIVLTIIAIRIQIA